MSVSVAQVYAVYGDNGGYESRKGPLLGIFSTEQKAKNAAKGKGWYGDGEVTRENAINLYGKWHLVNNLVGYNLDTLCE